MPSVHLRSPQITIPHPTKPKVIHLLLSTNRTLPALRLCPDLLEYIFLLGVSLERDPFQQRRMALSYSQTCHDWRVATLSMKSLWGPLADFDFMPWSWNEEMLSRSYPLPVKMGLCTFPPRNITAVEAELDHLRRIRTYRLGFTSDTWNTLVEKLQKPAEEIEYLSLAHVSLGPQTHSPRSYPSHPTNVERFVLPATLFSATAPRLVRLKLEGCFLDVRAPVLHTLTSLMVIDIDTRYNTAPTAVGWASLLSRMPSLRDLVIKNAIASPDSALRPRRRSSTPTTFSPPTETQVATLYSLAHLDLEGALTEVAGLLALIETPSECELAITCKRCDVGDELESVQQSWVKAVGRALGGRAELPMLISACGSTLSACADDRVDRHASAILDLTTSSSRPRPSTSLTSPSFYLDLIGMHSECWELFLPSLLSTFSDHSLVVEDDSRGGSKATYGPLVSRITSLEIILPAPHLDLVPFIAKAQRVEALVNLPGYFGAWLVEELRILSRSEVERSGSEWGESRAELDAEADDISAFGVGRGADRSSHMESSWSATTSSEPRRGARRRTGPLPRLQALSFTDDRCLYGSSWASLEGFLRSRSPSSYSHSTSTSEAHPRPLSRRGHIDEVDPVRAIAFRKCLAPSDKVQVLEEMGIAVECEIGSRSALRNQNVGGEMERILSGWFF